MAPDAIEHETATSANRAASVRLTRITVSGGTRNPNARQDVGGNSTTRPSSRPKSQTSMNGGSTPSVVRAVQIWLR